MFVESVVCLAWVSFPAVWNISAFDSTAVSCKNNNRFVNFCRSLSFLRLAYTRVFACISSLVLACTSFLCDDDVKASLIYTAYFSWYWVISPSRNNGSVLHKTVTENFLQHYQRTRQNIFIRIPIFYDRKSDRWKNKVLLIKPVSYYRFSWVKINYSLDGT